MSVLFIFFRSIQLITLNDKMSDNARNGMPPKEGKGQPKETVCKKPPLKEHNVNKSKSLMESTMVSFLS